jgi:hypothetical protein
MRDPSSPLIQSAYHDVPWEEPRLVEACMRHALQQKPARTQPGRAKEAFLPQSHDRPLIKTELKESRHE